MGLPAVEIVTTISVVALGIILAYAFYSFRRGPRGRGEVSEKWLAMARCTVCQREYECEWIPGVSFSAIRWGPRRYQKCLACRTFGWSEFLKYVAPSKI
jgi:hypothetical protein